jgi:predicted esterase
MGTAVQTRRLTRLLEDAGAVVTENALSTGHQLIQEDLEAAKQWLARP